MRYVIALVALLAPPSALAAEEQSVERRLGRDVFIAGAEVSVQKDVAGDLLAAGGRVHVDARVERNARIAGGQVLLAPDGRIAGGASMAGGEVRIEGAIDGYLQAAGGRVFVDGTVGGDLEVAAGALEVGPNARIGGRLRYASRSELRLDPAAEVKGGVVRFMPPERFRIPEGTFTVLGWVWSTGLIVLAAVLAALLPAFYAGVGATVRARWARALLVGLIALFAIPVGIALAVASIIGVPLALAAIALYFGLLLVGYVSSGVALGELARQRLSPNARTGGRVLAAVLGMLAVTLLARVPVFGFVFVLLALLLGLGALLMQLRARMTTL
jgi:cytoskeletal protein CcmA (bactofilin family)